MRGPRGHFRNSHSSPRGRPEKVKISFYWRLPGLVLGDARFLPFRPAFDVLTSEQFLDCKKIRLSSLA